MLVQAQVVPWWGTETGRAQSQRILMHWLDALLDSRSTRFPFTSTPSPPAPLAIRKAPSASVESIEPRPPQPCEVGRPKGRRRKSRRQSQKFFKTLLRLAPQLAATPWGGSPPRPLRQKICYSDCTENCPLRPLRAPRRFGIRKSASNSGHSPLRGSGGCSRHCSMHYSTHAALHFLLPTGDSR